MHPAFVGHRQQQQQQQQMLGTILEEEWMEEGMMHLRDQNEGQNGRKKPKEWPKKERKLQTNFGRKKPKGERGGEEGGGRVGKMVDWWMGRGGQWPNDGEQQEEEGEKDGQRTHQQQMVKLAKTTIELSPSRERDTAAKMINAKNTNKSNAKHCDNTNTWTTRGKDPTIALQQRRSSASAAEKYLADQQQKSEDSRGTEVSVSLQVVREHNVTISASCCFGAAEKKLPPLMATTAREMPLLSSIRQNGIANDGAPLPMVKKLELRLVDIELDEDEDDEMVEQKCKWSQRAQCQHNGSRQTFKQGGEEDNNGTAPTATQPKLTTGWAQFKRSREKQQREEWEDGTFVLRRRHPPPSPKKSSPPFSSSTLATTTIPTSAAFSPNSSIANQSANSAPPLLSPLCSPPQRTPPPPSSLPPAWLNISNGSSSGVGSSVSSVSPKSTDGEGERDNNNINNSINNSSGGYLANKMEQYKQQFRHTATISRLHNGTNFNNNNNNCSADYRVISLDIRPEPGRLEDFVPEVERATNRTAKGYSNSDGTNKASGTLCGEKYVAFNAKTLIREHRNYDLQNVDCWRRWSSLRRVPTLATTTTANGTKGGGTLPTMKREGKRRTEGDGTEEETLRRDERGRLIVDRREWRQFLAEQRTPSSRRVDSRIRLLNNCDDQNEEEAEDGGEQYGDRERNGRKKPMVIMMEEEDRRRAMEEEQQQRMMAHGNNELRTMTKTNSGNALNNGTMPKTNSRNALNNGTMPKTNSGNALNNGTMPKTNSGNALNNGTMPSAETMTGNDNNGTTTLLMRAGTKNCCWMMEKQKHEWTHCDANAKHVNKKRNNNQAIWMG